MINRFNDTIHWRETWRGSFRLVYLNIYIVLKCTFLLIDNKNGALHSWVAEPYKNPCMEKKKDTMLHILERYTALRKKNLKLEISSALENSKMLQEDICK